MKFATKAIHPSYDCGEHNRALMLPTYQNSMLALREIGERVPYRYSRPSNPTRQVLEDTIADLERGVTGFTFSSGMVSIDAVWRTFLRPGDTIVVTADIYDGAYDLLVDMYREWDVNIVSANLGNPDHLDKLFAVHNVKLVWLEIPSNPFLRLVDIKALAVRTHAADALVSIDNTFATPYLQQPLKMGYGVVFHFATRCLCGHSDVLMGIIAVKTKELMKPLHNMAVHTSAIAGPMDCRLMLCDTKTLALRMETHCKNMLDIARRLEAYPVVKKMLCPGLPSHEHYELARTQISKGIGGVVTAYLKNDACEVINSVTRNMRLIKMASSLGGVESLVDHCYPQLHSDVPHDVKMEVGIKVSLLHFSTGTEEADDIWSDIFKALDSTL